MAIRKRRPAVPSISDRSVEDLENYILGYESVRGGVNYSSESINDPYLSQEVVNILSDSNTDHGIFLAQAMECAGDAARFGQAADTAINNRKTLVALCNAFGRASMSKGYESLTPKSFWYSLEASGFADDAKDFGKRVWEAIKAAIKKLILMVINLVKSIGNFIKGAAAKAQEMFWKKYARKVLENAKLTAKDDVKMKVRSVSSIKVWEERPDTLLKKSCATLTATLNTAQSFISGKMLLMGNTEATKTQGGPATSYKNSSEFKKVIESIRQNPVMNEPHNKALSEKITQQAGKWFPSAASVVNFAVYGTEKPSKNEVPVVNIINQGKSLLEAGTLQAMSYCFKTANTANKSLQAALNSIEKIAKSKDTRTDVVEPVQAIRRLLQFVTTLLIQLYGTCLSARMTVYSAARKMVRKGSDKDKDKEEGANDAATAAAK